MWQYSPNTIINLPQTNPLIGNLNCNQRDGDQQRFHHLLLMLTRSSFSCAEEGEQTVPSYLAATEGSFD